MILFDILVTLTKWTPSEYCISQVTFSKGKPILLEHFSCCSHFYFWWPPSVPDKYCNLGNVYFILMQEIVIGILIYLIRVHLCFTWGVISSCSHRRCTNLLQLLPFLVTISDWAWRVLQWTFFMYSAVHKNRYKTQLSHVCRSELLIIGQETEVYWLGLKISSG